MLSEKYLKDFFRIQLNGPKKLEQFSANNYRKLQFQKGSTKTDDATKVRKKPRLSLSDNDD